MLKFIKIILISVVTQTVIFLIQPTVGFSETESPDTIQPLLNTAQEKINLELYAEALELLDSAMNIKNLGVINRIELHRKKGAIFKIQSNWSIAELQLTEALKLTDSIQMEVREKDLLKASIMLDISTLHIIYTAQYNIALEYVINALKISENYNDTSMSIEANRLMGFIKRQLHDYKSSEIYSKKSIDLARSINDTIGIIYSLNELANSYLLGDFEYASVLSLYVEALDLAKKTGNLYCIGFVNNDIGNLFYLQHDYRGALPYMNYSLNINNKLGKFREVCINAYNIGLCYMELKENDSAQYYYEMGIKVAEKYNIRQERLQLYEGMSNLKANQKDYKNAYEFNKKYIGLYDSIFNSEKEKLIAEMTTKYETAKKEKENVLLRQQNTIHQLQIEKSNTNLRNVFLTSLLIILFISVILWILYKSNRIKKQTNFQLEEKNRQIIHQKDQLVETLHFLSQREQKLEEANATKDRFFSIIAHDLKNPFSGILGFSELLVNDFDKLPRGTQKEYISYIHESSNKLYKLLENLLQWARTQLNQIDPQPKKIMLTEKIKSCIEVYNNIIRSKNLHIIFDEKCEISAFADQGMIDTVLRNLLSNAIKFTAPDGSIRFNIERINTSIEVTVADSGVGMVQEDLDKLFRTDTRLQKTGTANEQGTGLGLIICKEFIERNGGKIYAESSPGIGSRFVFTLPVS